MRTGGRSVLLLIHEASAGLSKKQPSMQMKIETVKHVRGKRILCAFIFFDKQT